MANLLDNALKYTTTGGVVTVFLDRDDNNVSFVVKDTGIGISPSDITHIFERFYRAPDSVSKPGHGLGLGMVRAIAHAHGGEVRVTSTVGQGSTFEVRLPRS
jgi:signal transduction histidine kinase